MPQHPHTNALIRETSPYLLQHAHNPVDWLPWGPEVFDRAKAEDKLVLISIGYSACHWCHVMEHESFEDETVAEVMNKNFICVKIDREERPDVDSVYMSAVQLMTQQGGWPLNCFTLPDGRPVYGGTYFPKASWLEILRSLERVYREERDKVLDYADHLTDAIRETSLIKISGQNLLFKTDLLDQMVRRWAASFDNREGGPNRVPKFPLPNNYEFLLHYGHINKDDIVLQHVHLTLHKMAYGGIYDQVGGGFSRYSVDELWKVPHFEKMLYDNAQLVSLYAKAWQQSGTALYMQIVEETLEFVSRELTDRTGSFYAALDADSEGEEGRYYIWKKEELEELLGEEDFRIIREYYNINGRGFWEHGNYILLRWNNDEQVAKRLGLEKDELQLAVKVIRGRLLEARSQRVRPGLDDKMLTSWNAMMIKAYADAYIVFRNQSYLDAAIKAADFIILHATQENGALWHTHKNGISKINGYLEDYCFAIEAYLTLYRATFQEEWLHRAAKLTAYTEAHFSDDDNVFFYFNSDEDMPLITRKIELQDTVIPSGNSVMAKNLFLLGKLLYNDVYLERAEKMLKNAVVQMKGYGPGYSNWAQLYLWFSESFHEIAICGEHAAEFAALLEEHYLPNTVLAASEEKSTMPLLEGKHVDGKTLAYVCHNKACDRPVENPEELVALVLTA